MKKTRFRRFKGLAFKRFDRDFYKSKGFQFLWLLGFFAVCWLFSMLVGEIGGVRPWRVMELLLDPGCFAGSEDEKCSVWIQLAITFIGAVCFTSFLINAIGNWLDRRVEAFRQGHVIYEFDDHILILGAGSMLLNLLKSLTAQSENADRDIVVQTSGDVESIRSLISSEIPEKQAQNIYVVYGRRSHRESLMKLDAFETKAIYILGEEDEPIHDATSLECLALLRDICNRAKRAIDCYITLERMSSVQHFYYRADSGSTDKLHISVINELENAAQRVLVSREYGKDKLYPALDRNGIHAESITGVHLVIAGMSQMAYALAATAAHICHFPNFRTNGVRTRITFIKEDIRKEMDFFLGRYQSLMELSYYRYTNLNNPQENKEHFPDKQYLHPQEDRKGFLDIEWEFIDGGIESEGARKYLEQCCENEGKTEYLTIAICGNDPETNVAASMYLPHCIYDKAIPVFVYQPGSGEVLRSAKQTDRYSNLYPFDMKSDSYDKRYDRRITSARRIAYLYTLANNGKKFENMPSEETLKKMWFDTQYAFQQSNLYAANSIPTKLRSIEITGGRLSQEQVETLSETEHNRWNTERLLVGFRAYPLAQRQTFKKIIENGDADSRTKCKNDLDLKKKTMFLHKDIAPYDELLQSSKEYDRAIVENILEVMK